MSLFNPLAPGSSEGEEVCVSLDLETTGLNADSDDIIEVGAVKFQGDRVLESFHTLLNPYRPLPKFIQELTGIAQGEVDTAPSFSSVAPRLDSFIGDCPIVGQNIAFDLGFLARRGLGLPNLRYDTRELASILLPRLREYALASLARSLGVGHPNPHRALADAQVTHQVFHALKGLALELDEGILSEIHRLHAGAQGPLAPFFYRLQETRSRARGLRPAAVGLGGLDMDALGKRLAPSPVLRLRKEGEEHPLDERTVEDFFQEGGPLARVLDGYRYRPQQVEMALAVARAMNQKHNLVVEGGTGVGKSLAYLLPAMLFALGNGARVVVSTNTINLQEQLISKDLPVLSKALEGAHPNLGGARFSLLKGRDNYLCLRRWAHLRGEGSTLSSEEACLASKVLVWLQATSTGDRSELNLASRDLSLWGRISAAGAVHCPPRREEACFLRAARDGAQGAHLVVVNHALLLRDLVEGGNILPDYDYLIIDEAHHLEEEATRQLGSRLSQGMVGEYLERLAGGRGIYREVRGFLGQLGASPRLAVLEPLVQEAEALLPRVREYGDALWSALATFLEHQHDEGDARQLQVRVTRSKRTQPDWSQVEVVWENVDLSLSDVARNLDRVSQALAGLEEANLPGYDTLTMEVSSCISASGEIRDGLKSFIVHPVEDQVYWMAQNGREGEIAMNSAPLHIGEILQEVLFSKKESVILTSATLSTQGHFQHISERLGLKETKELLVDSPFDYPRAALLYMPQDMPDPNAAGYQGALHRAIIDACRSAGGRTMVLFTSHSALRAARAGVRDDLEGVGIRVLAQGVDGTPRSLLEAFMERPEAVLLGTASFWEGVDIAGGALKVLIVARLPFNVPTEPVFAARSELLDDSFNQYAVPQAVLRFRQGFGRLIRGERDRGVVVLLDRRVLSRNYGTAFLESIPRCTVMKGSLRELPRAIKQWIAAAP